jgi:hypothetical protein
MNNIECWFVSLAFYISRQWRYSFCPTVISASCSAHFDWDFSSVLLSVANMLYFIYSCLIDESFMERNLYK